VTGLECEVCEDAGVVPCWSPGGPCPPEQLACELCGVCRSCRKGMAILAAIPAEARASLDGAS